MTLLGWGGYIVAKVGGVYDEAESIALGQRLLTDQKAKGYNSLRVESIPRFLDPDNSELDHHIHYAVLDALIAYARSIGMTIIIDPIHNYPAASTSLLMQQYFLNPEPTSGSSWLGLLRFIAQRYRNDGDVVVLECENEYALADGPGTTGQNGLFQQIVTDLRTGDPVPNANYPNGRAPCTLPLLFSMWWDGMGHLDHIPVNPAGTSGRIIVGHHVYASSLADTPMNPNEPWDSYMVRLGVATSINRFFYTPSDPTWFAYAKARGIEVVCTEVGPTTHTNNMNYYKRFGIALVREFMRQAVINDVGFIGFRVGDYSDYEDQSSLCMSYFGVKLEPWAPVPTGRLMANLNQMGEISVDGNFKGIGYWFGDLPVGPHIVSFGIVEGYKPLESVPVIIEENMTTTLNLTYEPVDPVKGYLNVTCYDEKYAYVAGPIFVNDLPVGAGTYTAEVDPGSYKITFGKVTGYRTPAPQYHSITAGGTWICFGIYETQQIGVFNPLTLLAPLLIGGAIMVGSGNKMGKGKKRA